MTAPSLHLTPAESRNDSKVLHEDENWSQPSQSGVRVEHNGLVIDADKYKVSLSGERIPLTLTEFQRFLILASEPEKVFTREALVDRLE